MGIPKLEKIILEKYELYVGKIKALPGWSKAIVYFILFIFIPLWPFYLGLFLYNLVIKRIKAESLKTAVRVVFLIYFLFFATPFAIGATMGIASPSKVQEAKQEVKQVEQRKDAKADSTPEKKLYSVVKVVDGDTVDVDVDGKTERIRLIGLDTPEIVDPRTTVQCFGKESSDKAHELLDGKKVLLEADPTQGERDKYDRLLRYIFLENGTDFSKIMIENGYGHEYTYEIPYKRQAEYKEAQKKASDGNKGLWAPTACASTIPTTNSTPTAPAVIAPAATTSTQNSSKCLIKGNISSSGEKIYHVPGGAYYDKTVIDTSAGERWFCTEAEAVSAGWRKSKL